MSEENKKAIPNIKDNLIKSIKAEMITSGKIEYVASHLATLPL